MDHLLYLVLRSLFFGVAVQQTLELLYAVLPAGHWRRYQKALSKMAAVLIGCLWTALASGHGAPLPVDEVLLAGLVTAAGAELTNALVKWLVYAKEARKAAAASALSISGSISLEAVSRK